MSADKPYIAKLDSSFSTTSFNCGTTALNAYLQRYALINQNSGGAQTYTAVLGENAVGYFSLSTAGVEYEAATERAKRGLARHPVPVILIARLAVDREWQGRGLGAALLLDALRRVLAAADIVGIRAVFVHAKDEKARQFYEHFDFDQSPVDPMHLLLLVKDIDQLIKSA